MKTLEEKNHQVNDECKYRKNEFIVKVEHHEKPYVIIDKAALEHTKISFGAKGLLAYLLTRPPDWSVHGSHLCTVGPDRWRKVSRYMLELEKVGHAVLETLRDKKGRVQGKQWIIFEIPTKPVKRRKKKANREPRHDMGFDEDADDDLDSADLSKEYGIAVEYLDDAISSFRRSGYRKRNRRTRKLEVVEPEFRERVVVALAEKIEQDAEERVRG